MKKIIIILVVLLLGSLIYYFPIQKSLATNAFEDYIVSQGTSMENIKSKEIFKDYKQGGYFINVIYKDDPEFMYEYTYLPNGKMFCIIYDETNISVDASNKNAKYPSLEK